MIPLITWYVPHAIAEDIDWIATLIFSPLKNPITPYYLKIVELVSRKFLYFIYIGLSEHIAIFNLG